MKRFQSAFAVPSGFAVSANAGKSAKAARRGEAVVRTGDHSASASGLTKARASRDLKDRAA